MKRLITLLLAVASAGSAVAVAHAQSPSKDLFYQPIYWSGFYAGVNAGGGWGNSTWNTSASSAQFDTSGGLLGGTAGYDWRSGRLVLGLEGDFDWSGIGASSPNTFCGAACDFRNTWLSTVRGRVGFVFGQWMPYVTGGAAFGEVKAAGFGNAASSANNTGWVAGFGIEYALTQNWNFKVEFLHADLGEFNCITACGVATSVEVNENLIRFGLAYQFPVPTQEAQFAALERKPRPGDTDDPGPKIAKKLKKSHDASKKHENITSAAPSSLKREF